MEKEPGAESLADHGRNGGLVLNLKNNKNQTQNKTNQDGLIPLSGNRLFVFVLFLIKFI